MAPRDRAITFLCLLSSRDGTTQRMALAPPCPLSLTHGLVSHPPRPAPTSHPPWLCEQKVGSPTLAQSLPRSPGPLPTRPCCPLACEEAGPCRKKVVLSERQPGRAWPCLCERHLWGSHGDSVHLAGASRRAPAGPASLPPLRFAPRLPGFSKAAFNR